MSGDVLPSAQLLRVGSHHLHHLPSGGGAGVSSPHHLHSIQPHHHQHVPSAATSSSPHHLRHHIKPVITTNHHIPSHHRHHHAPVEVTAPVNSRPRSTSLITTSLSSSSSSNKATLLHPTCYKCGRDSSDVIYNGDVRNGHHTERSDECDVDVNNGCNDVSNKVSDEDEGDDESLALMMKRRQSGGASCIGLLHAVHRLYRLDDFIKEKIGQGFYSDVFKVTHSQTDEVMALKMNTSPGNRANVLREIQMLNTLNHQNILRFHGVCVNAGQLHALTEFIGGGSLEQLLQEEHRKSLLLSSSSTSWFCRVKLALDIATALHYLHNDMNIMHRDLTSKNVLIKYPHQKNGDDTYCDDSDYDAMPIAIVGDFGLATHIPPSNQGKRLGTVGSPWWISPECLKGEFYNQQADIFSFGIILCEVISTCEADPDILPRTSNFGLDYVSFSHNLVPSGCPILFLQTALKCCRVDMNQRLSASEAVASLTLLHKQLLSHTPVTTTTAIPSSSPLSQSSSSLSSSTNQKLASVSESCNPTVTVDSLDSSNLKAKLRASPKRRYDNRTFSMSHCLSPDLIQTLPSFTTCIKSPVYKYSLGGDIYTSKQELSTNPLESVTARHVGEIMSLGDPHYQPHINNPFQHIPIFKDGRKLIGSMSSFDVPACSSSPLHSPRLVCDLSEDEDITWLRQVVHHHLSPSASGGYRRALSLPSSPTQRKKAQDRWYEGEEGHHHDSLDARCGADDYTKLRFDDVEMMKYRTLPPSFDLIPSPSLSSSTSSSHDIDNASSDDTN